MGYGLEDIFNSAKVLSSAKFNQESNTWSGYKFDYIKNILDSLISDDIDSLNVKKESLVKEILKLKKDLLLFFLSIYYVKLLIYYIKICFFLLYYCFIISKYTGYFSCRKNKF